jgi:transcriptional regulator with XRE-family HTH domain
MNIIGDVLRRLRKDNKLSQEKLAMEIGVTTVTISKWENEKSNISNQNIKSMAKYFGVSASTLTRVKEIEDPVLLTRQSKEELNEQESILLQNLMLSFERYAKKENCSYKDYPQKM